MKHSILLVEHDSMARSTAARMVETLGYHAIGVENADLALGVLKAVLIDVMLIGLLPDDDLAALAAIAKRAQPRLKVILACDPRLSGVPEPGVDAYVQKPFSLQELGHVLGRMRF